MYEYLTIDIVCWRVSQCVEWTTALFRRNGLHWPKWNTEMWIIHTGPDGFRTESLHANCSGFPHGFFTTLVTNGFKSWIKRLKINVEPKSFYDLVFIRFLRPVRVSIKILQIFQNFYNWILEQIHTKSMYLSIAALIWMGLKVWVHHSYDHTWQHPPMIVCNGGTEHGWTTRWRHKNFENDKSPSLTDVYRS